MNRILNSHQWFRVFHPGSENTSIWGYGEQTIARGWGNHIDQFINEQVEKYLFVKIAYGLLHIIEPLFSNRTSDDSEFEIWMPRFIIIYKNGECFFIDQKGADTQDEHIREIDFVSQAEAKMHAIRPKDSNDVNFGMDEYKPSYDSYTRSVTQLHHHIHQGDIYEINFCQRIIMENIDVDPLGVFMLLVQDTKSPFSGFVKDGPQYVLCASPERFIKKAGNQLLAEPMKGTAPRDLENMLNDAALKTQLYNSEKERAENVMIVDLTRNDMSKIAVKNTVTVDDLFDIVTFPHIHQMISRIRCTLPLGCSFRQIIEAMFPMGSMTGAPKIKAMQLIEEYEKADRQLFSGSMGMIAPGGDFDLNVVIRTIFYDMEKNIATLWAGSAITANSTVEAEFDECLLKFQKPMEALLNNKVN